MFCCTLVTDVCVDVMTWSAASESLRIQRTLQFTVLMTSDLNVSLLSGEKHHPGGTPLIPPSDTVLEMKTNRLWLNPQKTQLI